jgi:hypothetical protein
MRGKRRGVNVKSSRAIAILMVLSTVGCAATPKRVRMDADRPIETDHGYRQGGQLLESSDMLDKLAKERDSAPHVQRARALTTVAVILAAAGGALVGWPLGQKIGGNQSPTWELAYAGAGAIVVAIPLEICALSSVNSAVQAHNSVLGVDPISESR